MRIILCTLFACLLLAVSITAQTTPSPNPAPNTNTETKSKTKRFRANKDQITQAQKMLKVSESGKMDADTKTAVKTFQGENGLAKSGSLNRATLEKMNIALTDAQKEIPIPESSYASAKSDAGEAKKRGPVFRAN